MGKVDQVILVNFGYEAEFAKRQNGLLKRNNIFSKQAESLRTGKECECEELRFRKGSPLACGVMGIGML